MKFTTGDFITKMPDVLELAITQDPLLTTARYNVDILILLALINGEVTAVSLQVLPPLVEICHFIMFPVLFVKVNKFELIEPSQTIFPDDKIPGFVAESTVSVAFVETMEHGKELTVK